MSAIQIGFFVAILIGTIFREVLQRPIAKKFPPQLFPAFCGLFLVLICLISLPWTAGLLSAPETPLSEQPMTILVSALKAPIIWLLLKLGIELRAKSASSGIYVMPMGLAFVAITNFVLFGTTLTWQQWFSVGGLGLLGLGFACAGHLSELPRRLKLVFIGSVALCPLLGSIDHFVITRSNWFCHLFCYSVALAILSPLMTPSSHRLRDLLTEKSTLAAGSVFAIVEMIIIGSMVRYLPVSLVLVSVTMAVPIVMFIASWCWQESTPGRQLGFGLASFLIGLGVFF